MADGIWWWWVSAQALPSRFEVMGPLFICRGAAPVALTAAPAGTATATTAPAHWWFLYWSPNVTGKSLEIHKENGVQSSIRGFEMDWIGLPKWSLKIKRDGSVVEQFYAIVIEARAS